MELHPPVICRALISVCLVTGVVPVHTWAEELDLTLLPGMTEEARRQEDRPLGYDLVMSPVEKIHGRLKIERSQEAHGRLTRLTYRVPPGVEVTDVVTHFRDQVLGEALFECEGRDCGRSTLWANQVFGVAELYGLDRNQYYLAARRDELLIGLYVIQRGNRKVYVHLDYIAVDPPTEGELEPVTRSLEQQGYLVLSGVVPDQDGTLSSAAVETLQGLAVSLAGLDASERLVVCHLYGADPVEHLIEASSRCAERAVEVLGEAGAAVWQAFGAGPTAPREGQGARVELVVPTGKP
jgi:hypothetical protein